MTDSVEASLSDAQRAGLLDRLRGRRRAVEADVSTKPIAPVRRGRTGFADPDKLRELEVIRQASATLGIDDPYFRVHQGRAAADTTIGTGAYVNFSCYNYLGLSGHPRVQAASHAALERYGTSAGASRLVAGERPIHRELEQGLARLYGTEDCIVFVSGYLTNVTVIGHLMSRGDLIVHDALCHQSILMGIQTSGATRIGFAHNDPAAAETVLAAHRGRHKRALILVEGHYSMDGDVPPLAGFIDLANRYDALLMVDEAHSLGVLGATGRGIAEHQGIDPDGVDLWMGTLSKTLAGCGGYIAGHHDLIQYLKVSTPGFVYSVGMSPVLAAASLAALELMQDEPERVARLNANCARFVARARAAGLDTGLSEGHAIVPIVTGGSIAAGRLAHSLFRRGINVQPILYPAVAERAARLRFFLSSEHTEQQIDDTVDIVAEEMVHVRAERIDLPSLMAKLVFQARR
jgi:8-amino-7-oxononanoate synthase